MTGGRVVVFVAAFATAACASAAECLVSPVVAVPKDMKLVLLVGQSNMAGRAPLTEETRRPIERCWMLGRDDEWRKAANPIHFDKPCAGVGPADEFARRYVADHPGETLGLVPCAVGGSPLSSWLPEPKGPDGKNFRAALERIRAAKAHGTFVAMLWHQGETDAARCTREELMDRYPRGFSRIAAAFRMEIGDGVPVIVGEIGRWMRRSGDHAARVNPAIRECARIVNGCACVTSEGLTNKDEHHFDAPSAKTLGGRYYDAWKASATAASLAGEAHNVRIDTSPDRVKTPLVVDMERIGTLRPRSVAETGDSNWTIGCETLDRDFADFEQYKEFLAPLGIKTIRLQGGWAKCEREKGRYDFSWLDRIVEYARSHGLNVLLETGYGNPVYEGGGGKDLMGGFPTGVEALAAWDAWVEAMAKRYKGRVRDWAMWNEPDIGRPKKSVEDIVAFNLRTAKIIKRVIPDARIAGLSLAKNDPARLEEYLKAMGDGVALFDWFIYHGYAPAPESSYENVEKQKEVLRKYSQTAKMRQGENGCPSEMTFKFTLKEISWSEYSQAKWNMRRMLGDFGHDVESSVFTICDFNHIGKEMNLKGLLRADRRHNVIAVKRAYYAVQNVAGVFDSSLARVPGSNYRQGFGTKDASITSYEYRKNGTGERLFVFWTHGKDIAFERPGDSFETRPAVFMCSGEPLKDPVWVDLLSGRVYVFPKDRVIVSGPDEIRYLDVPVYDSPCVLTERSALEIDTGMNPDVARPCRDVRFSPLGVGTMLYGDPVHLVDGQPFAKDPTVIRLGGRYLMYYSVNDGEQWGGAIAESTNLVDWVRVGDIEVDGAPFKGGWVAPCVKKFDGKIHLFAQNPPPYVSDEAKKWNRIWHAVSDDGIHFAITPGYPVLGATGRWSNGRAIDAEAYRVDDKMMMAFATRNVDGSVQMQGLASSPYGSDYGADKWTELSVREPMLKPELPWEGHCIEAASVIERNGIWYMFYAGGYNHERQQIGLAWSADGVNFTRWRDTPVLPHGAEGSWNAWESGHPGVFEDDDGQVYLFYQGKATLEGGYLLSCLQVDFED